MEPLVTGAWADLVDTFAESGLPTPPVPVALRSGLRRLQPWCWATRDIDPMQMYMFDHEYLEDVLAERVEDYVAVSHAGHGINSYAINYHLVYGRLVILMQVGWGGVYTDNEKAAAKLADVWRRIQWLLDRPPPVVAARLIIRYSDLRDVSFCGWTAQSPVGAVDLPPAGEDPFETAERLWSIRA